MIKIYLKFLKLLKPIFNILKVDFEQLLAIVEVKLKMDNRRPRLNQATNQKESNSTLWFTMGLYALISSFVGSIIFSSNLIIAPYSLVFGYIMFMLGMILISDFSAVLLDSNDNAILLPRPIDANTMLIARIVHIMLYLLSLMLALSLPACIFTGIKYGFIASITFLIINVLSLILIVFITNIFYLVLMKFTSEERLRNIINYSQIVFTILLTIGYQFVGKLVSIESIGGDTEIGFNWWHVLLPPVWMGNFMEAIVNNNFSSIKLCFILLTIFMPILALLALKKYSFSNTFNEKIAGMDIANRNSDIKSNPSKTSFVESISSIFTGSAIEKGAFEFVWKFTARDRKFKLRIYPSMAYMLIYPFIIINNSQGDGSISQRLTHLQNSPFSALILIYLSLMMMMTIQMQITQTEEYKAAWIYEIAPLRQPGHLLSGAFKAVLVKFILPIIIICFLIIIAVWGITYLDDLLFGLFTITNLNLLLNIGTKNQLPFSITVTVKAGGGFLKVIGYTLMAFLIGFSHYFLMKVPYVISILAVFQFVLMLYLLKKYKELGWEKVSME